VSVLVMSVIERFLVFADPNGPVTKAPGHEGPHKESNDSHQFTNAPNFSNGRDSRFGLARPVLYASMQFEHVIHLDSTCLIAEIS
jgi:hypothetical protein